MVLRGIVGLDIYHNAEDKDEMIASVKTLFIGILILIMTAVVPFAATSIAAAM
jgi:hypothetical protein